jgi:hypothetical protein
MTPDPIRPQAQLFATSLMSGFGSAPLPRRDSHAADESASQPTSIRASRGSCIYCSCVALCVHSAVMGRQQKIGEGFHICFAARLFACIELFVHVLV